MKVRLEVDDFGMLLTSLDDFMRLKKHYPDFKVTCFTIPFPKEFFQENNQKHFRRDKYKKWAKMINSLGWIEIALHGFSHTNFEFDCSYEKATTMLKATENLWDEVGLKYKKIFRAPYWQYSYDSLTALRDRGYVAAINRNHPIAVPEGLKTYTFDWSFEEPLLKKDDVNGHGHVTPGRHKNYIGDCFLNITKQLPADTKFGFISELYE